MAGRGPKEWEGFVEHLERDAGTCTGGEPPEIDGSNRGYSIVFFASTEGDLVTAVSNGLRFQDLLGVLPQELACTVTADQLGAARLLVDLACQTALKHASQIEWGSVIRSETPVLAGTDIYGVLASTHPYFDDRFNALYHAGKPVLRVATLLPATRGELALFDKDGEDALSELWEQQNTPLYDVTRPAASLPH